MKDLKQKKSKRKTVKQMNTAVETYAYYLTAGLIATLLVFLLIMIGYFIFNILSLISMSGGII